jgi:hypothetical protein
MTNDKWPIRSRKLEGRPKLHRQEFHEVNLGTAIEHWLDAATAKEAARKNRRVLARIKALRDLLW